MENNEAVRILVVEDDAAQRETVIHLLRRHPEYQVSAAEDAQQALACAEASAPSLVLSDFYMPDMDGVDLCKVMKSRHEMSHMMFILMTASLKVEDKIRGFDGGADDFVTKPIHPGELLSRVRASLRIKGMRDRLEDDRKALAELNKMLTQSYSGVLTLLVQLMGLRIPNSTVRAERAERMARWIGERLGLDEMALHDLEVAARLHEIGKVGFHDDVLTKDPGTLTDEERKTSENFSTYGERLIADIPKLRNVGILIRHQLENYDGSGYPDKLRNQQIPTGSCILRLVNVIEQCGGGSERDAQSLLESICRVRGTVLDPLVVQLAEEYVRVIEDPSWLDGKRQVSILELEQGMVLAHDIVTGNGTKLLTKDSILSANAIERIQNHHHFDPVVNCIYVRQSA